MGTWTTVGPIRRTEKLVVAAASLFDRNTLGDEMLCVEHLLLPHSPYPMLLPVLTVGLWARRVFTLGKVREIY